jgi:hypothetical protein
VVRLLLALGIVGSLIGIIVHLVSMFGGDPAPEGCHLSDAALTSEDGLRQAGVMVIQTLAFVIVRRVLGLVGLGPAPDARDVEIAVLRQLQDRHQNRR